MAVQIERLDEPLEPLTLPRGPNGEAPGRTLPAQDFNRAMEKLWQRALKGDEEAAVALLRRCLPGITDDEIDELTASEVLWVFSYCARRLKEVADALGNAAGAAGPQPTTAPSAPTTSSTTPSPASPARSAETGGKSRRNRSAAPSGLSIG